MPDITTIVIIDNDEDDLEILRATIRSVHPETKCISFFDGDTAVNNMLKEAMRAPDLVFIDINMPRMSGDACLKNLRSYPKFDKTKIIMISTTVTESFRKTLEEYGATLVFTKPIDFKGYNKIIARCFDGDVHGMVATRNK